MFYKSRPKVDKDYVTNVRVILTQGTTATWSHLRRNLFLK